MKDELFAALKDSNQRAANWFLEIPASDFFTRKGEVWSHSDNLDHMIKAVKPITKALKLPKITLQAMFGKSEKTSISFEELCRQYREEIAKGGQASARYLPEQKSPVDNAEEEKRNLLEQWSNASGELVSVAKNGRRRNLTSTGSPTRCSASSPSGRCFTLRSITTCDMPARKEIRLFYPERRFCGQTFTGTLYTAWNMAP
jgi:hypothetical protein